MHASTHSRFRTGLTSFFVLMVSAWVFSDSIAGAQEAAKPAPQITIVTAVFGTGRAAGKCEAQIRAIIADPDAITEITTRGLKFKNPRGRWRDVLRITYLIDEKPVYGEDGQPAILALTNGVKVNLYQSILEHAAANANNKPAPAQPAAPMEPARSPDTARAPEVVVALPGKLAQVRTGGSGRFLIFHIPDKSILAVVDLVERKIVREITVSADVAFAASREKLLIALPRVNQLQRWDLTTLERDQASLLDRNHPADFAVMGSCGDGPLALFSNGHVQLWDVQELKLLQPNGPMLSGYDSRGYGLTVSADGKTFCGWRKGISPTTFSVMRLDNQTTTLSETSKGTGYNEEWVMPNTDGSMLFQHGGKAWTRDNLPVPMDAFNDEDVFPTESPGFIVSLRRKNARQSEYTICTAADLRRVHTLAPFDSVTSSDLNTMWGRIGTGLEPSFRYLPEHNLVACVPDTLDRVIIRDLDLKAVLDQTGKDYLFVTSRPTSVVSIGETFTYKPSSLSNFSNVQYSLDAGPEGMTIGPDGTLTWPVKNRPTDGIVNVIVVANAPTTVSSIHAFEINVKSNSKTELADASPGNSGRSGGVSDDTTKNNEELKKVLERDFPPPGGRDAIDEPTTSEAGNDPAVQLPGVFDMVRTGGEGRFLIFRIPEKEILAIFDLVKQETVKEIPAPKNVVFAASREKLLIAFPLTSQLQRWDLKSLSRDKHTQLDVDKPPEIAVMGASGDGPLLIWSKQKNEFQLWDIDQMKPIQVRGTMLNSVENSDHAISVSADGKTFCGGSSFNGRPYEVMRFDNDSLSVLKTPDVHDHGGRWAAPSGDGSLLLRSPSGAYYYDMTPIPMEKDGDSTLVPTEDPRYLLNIRMFDRGRNLQPSICSAADMRSILKLAPFVSIHQEHDYDTRFRIGGEARLRYLPQHNLIACLPSERDRVLIRKFDLKEALDKTGEKYLFVNSKPNAFVKVGETFEYQITTLSSSKVKSYSLDAGPPGMVVDSGGKVTWTVDARPTGSVSTVVIQTENADGKLYSHAFRLHVGRDYGKGVAGNGKAGPSAAFVKVDEAVLELPHPLTSITPGLDGRMLLLAGDQLAILGADGWTVESSVTLDKPYKKIHERESYYVAIADEPNEVFVLDKTNLKVIRSMQLGFSRLTDLVPHPTLPVSYIAGDKYREVPKFCFIVFDETKGEGTEERDWVGNWLAVDPRGGSLIASYADSYVSGSELMMNPTRWHVVPTHGYLHWLIRYKLDRKGIPLVEEVKEEACGGGRGIRMSPDGKRVCYVGHSGYPSGSQNQAGWNSKDLSKSPVIYKMKDRCSTQEVAFHPSLPIVASPGSGSAVFFNSETGEIEADRLAGDTDILTGVKVDRIHFSPDGKNLILDTDVNGVHYLHKLALKLKPGELKAVEAGASRKANEVEARSAPAATVPLMKFDALKGGNGQQMTTAGIARTYMESVVVVESGDVSGTGFVVGADGYLLTCAHCIPDPDDIRLSYKNSGTTARNKKGKLLWIDEEKDLALIHVSVTKPLIPVRLAIGHKVETGIPVAVIGNPSAGSERLDYTMTEGIVSSPSREIEGFPFLQSTAAVNPGSSGGPMFNDQGLVIGMVVLKARIEGAGFAIPASEIGRFLLKHLDKAPESMAIERDWFSITGEGPLAAVYLGHDLSHVKIRKTSDGKEYSYAIEKLGSADQAFLKMLPKTGSR